MTRHPLVSLLMLLGGMLLMLPGGCAAYFINAVGVSPQSAGSQVTTEFWYILWFVCFVISALGVYMLVKVIGDL